MARQQYRLSGEFEWVSNSGNALVVIANPAGSGKKLTLGSFEITNLSSTTGTTAAAAAATVLTLARATVAEGDLVASAPLDNNAGAWPSTVRVTRRAIVSAPTRISRVTMLKQMVNSAAWLAMRRPYGVGRIARAARATGGVEGYVVRAGESIALYAETLNNSVPVRVTAIYTRSGSPARTFTSVFFTSVRAADEALFAIDNTSGSGETITLRSISVEEVGTFDSPYFQLVPVGSIEAVDLDDPLKDVTTALRAMDSAYAAPSSFVKVLRDVVVYPFGMPENAFADSSAGSPKGFSYLKTKDFLGPVFRTLFPEQVARTSTGSNDYAGHHIAHRAQDVFARRAGITIREGEAIALVSAAETAAGATAAVGVSGWSSFHVAAQITVEPKVTPTLTLSGLENPSEVRVFRGSTTTLVAGQENVTSGTFSWTFDPDDTSAVDIAVLSLGYQNLRLAGVALALADVTIPIQQQLDRQYRNP